jgi:hypothetical protein
VQKDRGIIYDDIFTTYFALIWQPFKVGYFSFKGAFNNYVDKKR